MEKNFPKVFDTAPEVPVDDGYKDFGSFKICGRGPITHPAAARSRANPPTGALAAFW